MFQPDDPRSPPEPVFDAPWQAQALAMANGLIAAGHVEAAHWAQTLGAALRAAEAQGAPDTVETYYLAVLSALEQLCETDMGVTGTDRSERRDAWERAYRCTPHGKPVTLG